MTYQDKAPIGLRHPVVLDLHCISHYEIHCISYYGYGRYLAAHCISFDVSHTSSTMYRTLWDTMYLILWQVPLCSWYETPTCFKYLESWLLRNVLFEIANFGGAAGMSQSQLFILISCNRKEMPHVWQVPRGSIYICVCQRCGLRGGGYSICQEYNARRSLWL